MTDVTRRGFVAALAALAGCGGVGEPAPTDGGETTRSTDPPPGTTTPSSPTTRTPSDATTDRLDSTRTSTQATSDGQPTTPGGEQPTTGGQQPTQTSRTDATTGSGGQSPQSGGASGDDSASQPGTGGSCRYDTRPVDHTGVLVVANDTGALSSFDLRVTAPDGETLVDATVRLAGGASETLFRTGRGGTYAFEYAFEGDTDSRAWRVPSDGATRVLQLTVTSGAGGRSVSLSASTAYPPTVRVCE